MSITYIKSIKEVWIGGLDRIIHRINASTHEIIRSNFEHTDSVSALFTIPLPIAFAESQISTQIKINTENPISKSNNEEYKFLLFSF